jgi:hypothetical protein
MQLMNDSLTTSCCICYKPLAFSNVKGSCDVCKSGKLCESCFVPYELRFTLKMGKNVPIECPCCRTKMYGAFLQSLLQQHIRADTKYLSTDKPIWKWWASNVIKLRTEESSSNVEEDEVYEWDEDNDHYSEPDNASLSSEHDTIWMMMEESGWEDEEEE